MFPRELAARLHRVHEAQERQEARNVQAAGLGDAVGLETRSFDDGIWAVRASKRPDHPPGNQAMGLSKQTLSRLTEICDWFDEAGCTLHLRWPAAALPDVSGALAEHGLVAFEVESWMGIALPDFPLVDVQHPVELCTRPDQVEDWIGAFLDGWEIEDPEGRAIATAAMGPVPAPEGWRRFLVRVDGEPAGEALLALDGELAYLAEASTVPRFRRRGVQRALIAARAAYAREHGCRSLFAGVSHGDASWSNMHAMGLRDQALTVRFRRGPEGSTTP